MAPRRRTVPRRGAELAGRCGGQPLALTTFLDAGSAPICVGWTPLLGSAREATWRACQALRILGLRGVLLGGVIDRRFVDTELLAYIGENVLFLEAAPSAALMRGCRAAVHPGDSRATKAALEAGVPSVV